MMPQLPISRIRVVSLAAILYIFVLFELLLGPGPIMIGLLGRRQWNSRRSYDSPVTVDIATESSIGQEHDATNPALQILDLKSSVLTTDIESDNSSSEEPLSNGTYLSEPVDPHTYSYRHNPTRRCFNEDGSQAGIYLLFIVPSAPGNIGRRRDIRTSHGNATLWPTIDAAGTTTVFLLAATTNAVSQRRIDKEAAAYGDIVQEDFVDSYLNLTRKTVMGLKWASNHCRHARYVIKIDDDCAVNLPRIVEIIKDAPRFNFSTGYYNPKWGVVRDEEKRFFVSKSFYPYDNYPPYGMGAAYMMSGDVVEAVYHTAITLPLFPWEDVFVGMCLNNLGVKLRNDDHFVFFGASRKIIRPHRVMCPPGFAVFFNLFSNDHIFQLFSACRTNNPAKTS